MSTNPLEMLPKELLNKKEKEKFEPNKTEFLGIYFSAHWCGPCRGFTPVLSKFYNKANEKDKKIEIIFNSLDHNEEEFNEYYGTMPWLAIPFESDPKESLFLAFNLQSIPTLLIFNKEGKLVDKSGRETVEKDGDYTDEDIKGFMEKWAKA